VGPKYDTASAGNATRMIFADSRDRKCDGAVLTGRELVAAIEVCCGVGVPVLTFAGAVGPNPKVPLAA
jgi:hypothetical protein